ncbi:hypothetical protein GQ55_8G222800 [Panicum hallii var. hallii]|uniref:Uncharacterized protein n=1 Tax=Panicum hallii var. hallii TaxID=1504633 RepID=A0A2T7CPZ9_9POAL|nr:hypothetical protein GQ55_8G222800 [Panicum hallii var. hallii]
MTHLLMKVLGCTFNLSRSLQRRDRFLVNGIHLIGVTKECLDEVRGDHGWETLLNDVTTFCAKHDIKVPSMDDIYEPVLRSKGFFRKVKNLLHYRVEIFTSVIDRHFKS